MQIIESPREMQAVCKAWRRESTSVGFVPTMGALHEGHLALCRRARAENEKFAASIFVNPLQFRAGEDLEKYPRPFERDCRLLEEAGCDALFAPTQEAIYGSGEMLTAVDVARLSTLWEGAARPGHFRGVTTIVAKLFNIVPADRAYFGEKDFQQLKIIERMTADLNFDTEIVPCETVREADGLALSSRNAYLNAQERAAAPALYRALRAAQSEARGGEASAKVLLQTMQQVVAAEPALSLDYATVVDTQTLEPIETVTKEKPARALIAARAGSTRLIDNLAL
jgi:pantoate--beta-alanine ligase